MISDPARFFDAIRETQKPPADPGSTPDDVVPLRLPGAPLDDGAEWEAQGGSWHRYWTWDRHDTPPGPPPGPPPDPGPAFPGVGDR